MEKYRVLLLQQLAAAASLQLPLPYALRSVASGVGAKELRARILEIANWLETGAKLSKSLERLSPIFDNRDLAAMAHAEEHNRLPQVLQLLAGQAQLQKICQRRFRGELVLVLTLGGVVFSLCSFLLKLIIPKLGFILRGLVGDDTSLNFLQRFLFSHNSSFLSGTGLADITGYLLLWTIPGAACIPWVLSWGQAWMIGKPEGVVFLLQRLKMILLAGLCALLFMWKPFMWIFADDSADWWTIVFRLNLAVIGFWLQFELLYWFACRFLLPAIRNGCLLFRAGRLDFTIRFFQFLELSFASKIPAPQAMEGAVNALGWNPHKTRLKKACAEIQKGRILSEVLDETRLFSSTELWLLRNGEARGMVGEACGQIAEFFSIKSKNRWALVSTWLMPLSAIGLGTLVGLVAYAIFGTFAQIVTTLQ